MQLFITSSPYLENVDRALLNPANGFLHRIRAALPENPRVVFVAADPADHAGTCQFAAVTTAAFSEVGIFFSNYQVLDQTTVKNAWGMLTHCDFVVLSGGHVPTQNSFFRQIRLRHLLRTFSGTVMGISAGSMNMADTVYAQPEEPGESTPDFPRFLPGLSLTPVNVLPHYQNVKDTILDGKRLYEDITYPDSIGQQFFILPDGSYIYQDDADALLCGEAYRLSDGILEHLTQPEEVLPLHDFFSSTSV